jgi:thiosulfate dehydrogenase (quinone) large subunit
MNKQKTTVPGYLLTILRIYLGVILIITVVGKLFANDHFSKEMLGFLDFEINGGRPAGSYKDFLQSLIIPHARTVSYLIMFGETIAGIGLLLGAFTRLSALIAIVLFLNYMLAKGRWFWSPDSEDAAVFFIALIVFLGRAGRIFGLDRLWPAKFDRYSNWLY